VTALLKAEPALKDKPMNKFDGPIMAQLVRNNEELRAALRQRADEATRAENEACAKIADGFTCGLCGMDGKSAAAIRARIKP
jgi:hypothetical protein